VQETQFFGLVHKTQFRAIGLSINVGGAVIPILLSFLVMFTKVPIIPTLIATLAMIALSWKLARVEPGRGISLPMFVPPIAASILGFLVAPHAAAFVAFVSGVLGVLIGADLLHIKQARAREGSMLSIGGAGVFDGIFLVGIFAVLLASL